MTGSRYVFSAASTALDLAREMKAAQQKQQHAESGTRVSVTVLANVATQYLVHSIYTSLVCGGMNPEIYESSFDQWEFELRNRESETFKRDSDFVLLVLSSTRLILNPDITADEFAANLKNLIEGYKEKCGGEIIVVLPESLREGFDQTSCFHQRIKALRTGMENALTGMARIVDIDPLIMEFGFDRWQPGKFLVAAKLCCHPNCFPLYGNYVANYMLSLIRRPVKLVVTDLDDTLWHGVVGDLGPEGVGLDKDASGRPHVMLQHYLLDLKRSGVLLAVCSKNSPVLVKKVFDTRREMVLSFDDFVAHEINWNPKSESIKHILGDLNLTETGVVFLDNDRFEREEVRNRLSGVVVPELPENAESWCEFLSRSGCFTVGKISREDLERTNMYHAEKKRKEDTAKYADYSEFLRSLQLSITADRVSAANFDRVMELIHKTNQFNLTTRRLAPAELQRMAASNDCFCYCYSLQDKYGDYGIISVFIAEKTADKWGINTWLMSCRTMGRGVENFVFNHFLSTSLKEGDVVLGEYIPTDKNMPIKDLLDKMGFENGSGLRTFVYGRHVNPGADHIALNKAAEH